MSKATGNNEIMLVDEIYLKDKIYRVRGVQVILDFDLAEIYGYTTKRFNEQVKNNIDKFDEDFMFQLTRNELDEVVRSKKSTSRNSKLFQGQSGGSRYLPHAFTEQGLYMLMTVLRGDLATQQSKNLIRLFKSMKDYLTENQPFINQQSYTALIERVEKHSSDIREIKENMVSKADLSDFMKIFDNSNEADEILILEGQPLKADVAYQKIYKKAKKSIIVIDDYIGVKTLHHIAHTKTKVKRIIITDNRGSQPLRQSEYNDYLIEYQGKEIAFIKANHKIHDRFIIVDNETIDMKVYLCGSSSKDSGKRVTTITELKEIKLYKDLIKRFLKNPELRLR